MDLIYKMRKAQEGYKITYDYNGHTHLYADCLTKDQAKNIYAMHSGKSFKAYLNVRKISGKGFSLGVKRENRVQDIINKKKKFEVVFDEPEEYEISSWYLSALINDDYSSFDYYFPQESKCERAIKRFKRWVKNTANNRIGHWSYFSDESENEEEREKAGEHMAFCEVSGQMSSCETVVFHPQRQVMKA
jgi:hypothetical protein